MTKQLSSVDLVYRPIQDSSPFQNFIHGNVGIAILYLLTCDHVPQSPAF